MNVRELVNYGRSQRYLPFVIFIPVISATLLSVATARRSHNVETACYFVLGLFSWTLIEYFLHRFSFHKPRAADGSLSLGADAHLRHHRLTNDPNYVVAPVAISIVLFSAYSALLFLIARNMALTATASAGLATGYLVYEHIHLALHRKSYKSKFMNDLKNNHMAHHFKNSRRDFGVTSPVWDVVFQTRGQAVKSTSQGEKVFPHQMSP